MAPNTNRPMGTNILVYSEAASRYGIEILYTESETKKRSECQTKAGNQEFQSLLFIYENYNAFLGHHHPRPHHPVSLEFLELVPS